MGFFSNLFTGGSVALDTANPIQTITVEKKKKRYHGDGKENTDFNSQKSKSKKNKNKKGWGFNKKKKKKNKEKSTKRVAQVETPAPKLSVFLQQNSELDEESLNHTIDTGSLTASLTASLNTSDNQPQHQEYVRLVTQYDDTNTRPPSAAGVSPPPLNKAFPMDGVTEDSSGSNSITETEKITRPLQTTITDPPSGLPSESPSDPPSDTEKSDSTAETSDDLDLSPSLPARKSLSVSIAATPDAKVTEISPPYLDDAADLSDPAASLDSSDVSSENSDDEAIQALNQLTAELSAEVKTDRLAAELTAVLDTMPKVEPVDESIADSLSLVDSEDAVDNLQFDEEDSANADLFFLDLGESSTNIADLLQPIHFDFNLKTIDQDYFSAVNSENVLDDGTFGNDSANADLAWKPGSENDDDSFVSSNMQIEIDMDILLKKEKSVETKTEKKEAEVDVVKGKKETLNNDQVKKSFDQIVNEVEETITNSQKLHSKESKENSWIPNGLMNTVRDDSSIGQSSTFSFTSDDFREEDSEVHQPINPMKIGVSISTITEEAEDEGSECPMDLATERGLSRSQEESDLENSERENAIETLRQTLTTTLTPPPLKVSATTPAEASTKTEATESTLSRSTSNNSSPVSIMRNSINGPKSGLVNKSLPRPVMKKSVSWKDETDVFTYLPPQAQDLQKARDLVASYAKIMAALNAKRPSSSDSKSSLNSNEDEKSHSSASDADLSEASSSSTSSLESLLSALSNASSSSSESMKLAIQQITEETEKLVSQQLPSIEEEEKEEARNDMLENKWPETVESTQTSSSSLESLLSALSHASSNSSGSVKMVVEKLKREAEEAVIFSSQKLEEEKIRMMREKEMLSCDASGSSSSFSSMASSDISTGTSESVKKLMKELQNERSKQAKVFTSTMDMFSLLRQNSEEARIQIIDNDWIDGIESGSSSSLSSLLSASPTSSQSTNDSSESVQYMMQALKRETERHKQRRQKIRSVREFVDSVCCIPSSNSQIFTSDSNVSNLGSGTYSRG